MAKSSMRPSAGTRLITHIVVCYWTAEDTLKVGTREIDDQFRRLGYLNTPYHFCVKRDGTIQAGRKLERAGVIDHPNASASINVVIVLPPEESGTGELAKYTPAQRESAEGLIMELRKAYPKAALEALGPVRDCHK